MINFNGKIFDNSYVKFLSYLEEAKIDLAGRGNFGMLCEEFLINYFNRNTLILDSCTSALEVGLKALNFNHGAEVILPSFTFSSCANAIINAGLVPIFCDIETQTLNIDSENIESLINSNTKAILFIHYAGIPGNISNLEEIARDRKLALIEDNAHSLGATYRDRKLGTIGDFSTLSFHGTKNFVAGEGGAITSSNEEILNFSEIYREKGTDRTKYLRGDIDKYTWQSEGSSMVMDELSACLLFFQFQDFEIIQHKRVELWFKYHRNLKDWCDKHSIIQPTINNLNNISGHIYWLMFPNELNALNFKQHMRERGIEVTRHYVPLDSSPAGLKYGKKFSQLVNSQKASENIIRLPIHPNISDENVDKILTAASEYKLS